jgi:uncharacterized Zn-finger protein
METIPPPETYVTESRRVFCDGDEPNTHGLRGDGHPRVWLEIDARGYADCGYCDRRFILAGGPADKR